MKIPAKLGAAADLLYRTRERRYALQKQVDNLHDRETEIQEHLIRELPKDDATGVAGRYARASVVTKIVPKVADWNKVYSYIHHHRAYEMLQRRLTNKAVEERWEAGKEVPGIDKFRTVTVSLNKV